MGEFFLACLPAVNRGTAAHVLAGAEYFRQIGWVVMRFTLRRPGGMPWAARATVAALLVGGTTVATAGIATAAQAQVRPASAGSSATVVQQATRPHFGKILVTVKAGMALYEHPHGGCSAACESIWPPLLMPKGKTMPKGAMCLGTAKAGSKLQVTYNGQRLYTFVDDTGHSVDGNGLAGFKVAKVTTTCTG
jgi:predicted lipoprotein with Yx(FWY)xxD motif